MEQELVYPDKWSWVKKILSEEPMGYLISETIGPTEKIIVPNCSKFSLLKTYKKSFFKKYSFRVLIAEIWKKNDFL